MASEIEPDDMRQAPAHSDEKPAVVTSDSARQGPQGWRVLYVLVAGVVAACVIGAILIFWSNHTS
jgi:hypothetical protein